MIKVLIKNRYYLKNSTAWKPLHTLEVMTTFLDMLKTTVATLGIAFNRI